MHRYKELINQYKDEYGILPAKRMAKAQFIQEQLKILSSMQHEDARIDMIVKILILMNEKD